MNSSSNKKEGAGKVVTGEIITPEPADHDQEEDLRSKATESKLFAVVGSPERQSKTNEDAEEKVPEDETVDGALLSLSAAPFADMTKSEQEEYLGLAVATDGPGAIRVQGIGQERTLQQSHFGGQELGEEHQVDDAENARTPGDVVAVILDNDQLYNEFRSRHDVVHAEKVVTLDEGNGKARRRLTALAVAFVIAIAAVIIGVLVSTATQSNKASPTVTTTPVSMVSSTPTVSTAPTAAPTIQRLEAFRLVLLNHSVSSAKDLSNIVTNQHQSLDWLANFDPIKLDVRASADSIIDRYILVVVFFATNDPGWTHKLNFLSNSSICQWNDGSGNGVFCNTTKNISIGSNNQQEQKAVSTLRLVANQLRGRIPTELGRLSNLTTLDLSDNDISGGKIPTELGRLSNLITLDLSYNQLTGSIPSNLRQLTSLSTLDLAYNQLYGEIPSELGRLSSLTSLNLFHNQLDSTIPSELGRLSSLTYLDLSENVITGTIPTELGRLSNLTNMDLSENQLAGTIPTELGRLSNLAFLNLAENQLSGTVPTELIRLASLGSLDLLIGGNVSTGNLRVLSKAHPSDVIYF